MMIRMFEEITDAARVQSLRRAIAFLSREKFNWNQTYIATTTAGESYTGKLAGRDGEAFMMRSDDDRILIGRATDIDPAAVSVGALNFAPAGLRHQIELEARSSLSGRCETPLRLGRLAGSRRVPNCSADATSGEN
jgi:hypothetical protein